MSTTTPAAKRLPTPDSTRGDRARRPEPPPARRKFGVEVEEGKPGQPPTGGPLALHGPSVTAAKSGGPAPVGEVVDRVLVGRTREGLAEVRLDVGAGKLEGIEVRLVAGRHGLEATLVSATAAGRHAAEAQLGELAKALEARGIEVARCAVADRDQREQRDQRQQRWQGAEDGVE